MAKFKRRPNKAGSIVKLSGNRRNPFLAKIMDGYKEDTGYPKMKIIGYYESWDEANNALSLYKLTQKKMVSDQELASLDPLAYTKFIEQRDKSIPTLAEIWEEYREEKDKTWSFNTQKAQRSFFSSLKPLHDSKINNINLYTLQELFDSLKVTSGTKGGIKSLVQNLFRYSVRHQYIKRDDDFTEFINIGKIGKSTKHYAFTYDEIIKLIKDGSIEARIVLIYIYTGCRISELINLPKEAFHIDEEVDGIKTSYIRAGVKTSAGKNRVIPIHDFIKDDFVELFIKHPVEWIFSSATYARDSIRSHHFYPLMKRLGMEHTPHDTRDTFATICKDSNVDRFYIQRAIGHSSGILTEDTYTDTIISTLYLEINKMKVPEIE